MLMLHHVQRIISLAAITASQAIPCYVTEITTAQHFSAVDWTIFIFKFKEKKKEQQ